MGESVLKFEKYGSWAILGRKSGYQFLKRGTFSLTLDAERVQYSGFSGGRG